MNVQTVTSPNFDFLKAYDSLLVRFALEAERYCFTDPNVSLFKLRQFAEMLAKQAAAFTQNYGAQDDSFNDVLRTLRAGGVISGEIAQLFHENRGESGTESERKSVRHLSLA